LFNICIIYGSVSLFLWLVHKTFAYTALQKNYFRLSQSISGKYTTAIIRETAVKITEPAKNYILFSPIWSLPVFPHCRCSEKSKRIKLWTRGDV